MSECGVSRRRRGLMLVLSSPSGAGKSTLSRRLLAADPQIDMSISATTRPPRPGEVSGKDYFFLDKAQFEQMVSEGAFLEHAKVFGNYYGTPKAPVVEALSQGRDILFDIDWQGAQQLNETMAGDLVRVFIFPPSRAELERRLHARAQDAPEVIQRRMAGALNEITHSDGYDYVIVNDDLELAYAQLQTILGAERLKRNRQPWITDFVRGFQPDQM